MEFSEDRAHCSAHNYYSTGCRDCDIHVAYFDITESRLQKAERLGIHPLEIDIANPGPNLQLIKNQLSRKVYVFLVSAAADVIKKLRKEYNELDRDGLFQSSYEAIKWEELMTEIQPDLTQAVQYGGLSGIAQLELSSEDYSKNLLSFSGNYGRDRSAQMVSKRWEEGALVDSSRAHYSVASTTKDDLQFLVVEDDHDTLDDLANSVQTASIFSRNRAELIAATEIAMAQYLGTMHIWKSSGLVESVSTILHSDHEDADVCDMVHQQGPYALDKAPMLPLHPNCRCGMQVVQLA